MSETTEIGSAATQNGDAIAPRRSEGAPSVLVVDSDAAQLVRVVRLLRGRGFHVSQADRGLQALSLLRADPPGLLILETQLSEINGFDLVRKVKSNERYRHIRTIVISESYRGWRIAEDLRETFHVDAFLEKPFRLNTLWHIVESVLESKPGGGGREHRISASAFKAYREGIERSKSGDVDGAIACIVESVRLDPLAAKLHFQLGVLYLKKKGMTYPAIQAFEEVLKLDPRCFAALRTLGSLYEQKGFRNQAMDMWERALRCSPDEDTATQMKSRMLGLL